MCVRSAWIAIAALFLCAGLAAEGSLAAPIADPALLPPQVAERGIWAAIAYSKDDAKYGFFWGADKPSEATQFALEHCQHAGGRDCNVVALFRNHRHRDDDDHSGFPYWHCGALAVARAGAEEMTTWAAKSAPTRRAAEDQALRACGATGVKCEIREWVCT